MASLFAMQMPEGSPPKLTLLHTGHWVIQIRIAAFEGSSVVAAAPTPRQLMHAPQPGALPFAMQMPEGSPPLLTVAHTGHLAMPAFMSSSSPSMVAAASTASMRHMSAPPWPLSSN